MTKYHIPALLQDSIKGLNINPNGIYIDVTFGGGGHSKEIFKLLDKGQLIAFDQDKDAIRNLIDDSRFHFVNHNFRHLPNFLNYLGFNKVDGILADLGVSSHHFNEAERGFSFRFEGPLDMRMNQSSEKTAANILNTYITNDLLRIFRKYGEIKNASKLSRTITTERQIEEFKSIEDFIKRINNCIPKNNEHKYLAKVFQALRIEVNDEMGALEDFLLQTPNLLAPGGRLVIITYHSLEDRLVKNFFRSDSFDGIIQKDLYGNPLTTFKLINRKVIIPSEEEINANNRVRSAKMRIAEKI